jgi:hypothetical protein
MTPCSLLSFKRRFGRMYRLHLQGRRNRFSKPASKQVSSTLKMEAIHSSETLVETQRTTQRHIPEDDTLQNQRCENLHGVIRFFLSCWGECHRIDCKFFTSVHPLLMCAVCCVGRVARVSLKKKILLTKLVLKNTRKFKLSDILIVLMLTFCPF